MSKYSYNKETSTRHKNAGRCCGHEMAHAVSVARARTNRPDGQQTEALAELFKAFGDVTRVRLLGALLSSGEMCVYALAESLDMTQSAISHQLRLLRQMRLIRARKEGRSVFYALNDDHIHLIFSLATEHVRERH